MARHISPKRSWHVLRIKPKFFCSFIFVVFRIEKRKKYSLFGYAARYSYSINLNSNLVIFAYKVLLSWVFKKYMFFIINIELELVEPNIE